MYALLAAVAFAVFAPVSDTGECTLRCRLVPSQTLNGGCADICTLFYYDENGDVQAIEAASWDKDRVNDLLSVEAGNCTTTIVYYPDGFDCNN
jgi:hypothetical protein